MALPTTTNLESLIKPGVTPKQWYKIECVFEDELKKYPKKVRDLYVYDEETRTYSLPNDNWLEWRKHAPDGGTDIAIGGSTVAALFDGSKMSEILYLYDGQHGSRYKAAIELFYELSGISFELQEKQDNDDVLWTGHNEEPSIRRLFKKLYLQDHPGDEVEVINDTHMYQSSEFSSCLCNLDGIVVINGEKGILECKTCNFTSEDYPLWKEGKCPLKYYLQVCWYLYCMNLPYAYIICKWGLQPSDCTYIYIERNFDVEELLVEMVKEFVECVRTGKEPNTTGQDIERLNIFWRKKMGRIDPKTPVVQLDPALKDVLISINGINHELEMIEQRTEELKTKRKKLLVENIFPVFGTSTFGILKLDEDTTMKIKLKKARRKTSVVDEELLKTENPAMYNLYLKKEEKFDKALFKKEQKILYEKYTSSEEGNTLTPAMQDFCEIEVLGKEA